MSMNSTIRGYGQAARVRAESMGHRAKDRMLEKRLDRANHESDRLRFENEMLRDEVGEARIEHRRILDLLEGRLLEEASNGQRSHKGRWMIVLLALGGGAYALIRQMRQGEAWNPAEGATA